MFEQLKLDRPLVVFDIESTGVVPQRDRIVEIAVLKIMPDGESRTVAEMSDDEKNAISHRANALKALVEKI